MTKFPQWFLEWTNQPPDLPWVRKRVRDAGYSDTLTHILDEENIKGRWGVPDLHTFSIRVAKSELLRIASLRTFTRFQ